MKRSKLAVIDPVDYMTIALTLWREARGESLTAKRAIYWVIQNRVRDTRWPDTAYSVCLQPKQFSCFNRTDVNSTLWPYERNISDWHAWLDCRAVLADPGPDPTRGANHYHHKAITPSWHDAKKITARIGNHIFLKL